MKTRLTTAVILFVAFILYLAPRVQAQDSERTRAVTGENQKRAQTGMKFMSLSIDPRAAALGNAATSVELGAASIFYNPAAMARMDNFANLSLGQVQWIADISYDQASVALAPMDGQYGVVGISFRSVNYGEFERTRRSDNTSGYVKMGSYSPSAVAVGLSYARTLTDRFSVGGNVKYVRQTLGTGTTGLNDNDSPISEQYTLGTPAFDFGVMYNPGIRSLTFAMSARNFSPAIEYIQEGFELPLTLAIGVSMDMMDLASTGVSENHDLLLSVDASNPRDFSETVSIGGEYSFMDIVSLRAGYTYPQDEQGLSLGGGLQYAFSGISVQADYAYTQFGVFGDVNRLALHLGF